MRFCCLLFCLIHDVVGHARVYLHTFQFCYSLSRWLEACRRQKPHWLHSMSFSLLINTICKLYALTSSMLSCHSSLSFASFVWKICYPETKTATHFRNSTTTELVSDTQTDELPNPPQNNTHTHKTLSYKPSNLLMLASNLLNPIHRAPHLSSFMNTKSSSLIKWCLQNSANSCLGTLHQEKFSAKIAQMQSEILIQKETTPNDLTNNCFNTNTWSMINNRTMIDITQITTKH